MARIPLTGRRPYNTHMAATSNTEKDSHAAAPTTPGAPLAWDIDAARALYNIEGWGDGFFDISPAGNVVVRPNKGTPERTIDLFELAHDLEAQGVGLPVLLRFSDILKARIEMLHSRFARAIEEFQYEGQYTTVYPIKVNQQRHVVEEIVEFGNPTGVGLECGSKPELQAVLALSEQTDHLIVCNGYKDEEFIRLALMGQKLGHTVIIVIEQVSELDVLLPVAEEMGITPTLGVRIKLSSEGSGRWAQSGGEKSKFGLNAAQLIEVIDRLSAAGKADWIKLIHFHLGSQITDIRFIKAGLQEVSRFYVELRRLGLDIRWVDVGGGLGVDYDGTQSTAQASMNYSVQEYANDIVYTLAETCREENLPHPDIISESGRALTAHHALLLLSVIDVESAAEPAAPVPTDDDHALLHEMNEDLKATAKKNVSVRRVREIYHDATFDKERAQQLFASGVLSLRERAMAEQFYLCTLNALARLAAGKPRHHDDIIKDLDARLVDRYFCNFSLFQSLPDSWAIDQLFPIMPIHRLDERPTRTGVLADITCDSDGKIDKFVSLKDPKRALELHELREGEDYYLAAFLVGAYQETLGDLHNLFGDTHVVHIRLHDEGGWWIEEIVKGDTANKVLEYMEYDVAELYPALARDCERAIRDGRMTLSESQLLKRFYEGELNGYAYLEPAGAV